MGRFLTRAMSRRFSRRNWMSAPSSRLSVACCSRPSGAWRIALAGRLPAGSGRIQRLGHRGDNVLLGTAKSSRPSRLREHEHCQLLSQPSSHAQSVGRSSLGPGDESILVDQIHG